MQNPFQTASGIKIPAAQARAIGSLNPDHGTTVEILREWHQAPDKTRLAASYVKNGIESTVMIEADGNVYEI